MQDRAVVIWKIAKMQDGAVTLGKYKRILSERIVNDILAATLPESMWNTRRTHFMMIPRQIVARRCVS